MQFCKVLIVHYVNKNSHDVVHLQWTNCSVSILVKGNHRQKKRFSVEPARFLFSESKTCFNMCSCRKHVEKPFPFTWWEEVLGLYKVWGEGKVCRNGNNTTRSMADVAVFSGGPLYSETYWPRAHRKVAFHMITCFCLKNNFYHFSNKKPSTLCMS